MSNDAPHIPTLSAEARAALDIFYEEFNDIHFFVEDADQENLYEIVLKKLFPALRIARVIPLGGKSAVLAHAQDNPQTPGTPFRAYLVDKDFDDLLAKCVVHPSVFYLERYCIENYFVAPEAFVEIVIESHPKQKRAEVAANLNCDIQIHRFIDSLKPLFALFLCVQRFGLGIKNSSIPPEAFCCARRHWEIEFETIQEYSRQVSAAAALTQHADALRDPLVSAEARSVEQADGHRVVSGKYLCTLFFHYIKSKYSLGSISLQSFVYRLAKNCSIAPLAHLGNAIADAAGAADPRYVELARPAV